MNCVKEVINHLEFLLSSHDCVAVKGLGTFYAQYCSARFDLSTRTFTAPGRTFFFDEIIKDEQNACLLGYSISRANNISLKEAEEIIKNAIEEIRHELLTSREFTLGRIGRFESRKNALISFISYTVDYLTPLSNWIGNIDTTEIGGTKNVSEQIKDYLDTYSHDRKNKIWHYIKCTAGAAAAILIALIVSTPIESDNTFYASTTPVVSLGRNAAAPSIKESDVKENESTNKNVTEQPQLNDSITADTECLTENLTEIQESEQILNIRFDENDPYILVVGSFNTLRETERFINECKSKSSVSLNYVKYASHYRIYAATGNSYNEAFAQSQKDDISKIFSECWVTRKS